MHPPTVSISPQLHLCVGPAFALCLPASPDPCRSSIFLARPPALSSPWRSPNWHLSWRASPVSQPPLLSLRFPAPPRAPLPPPRSYRPWPVLRPHGALARSEPRKQRPSFDSRFPSVSPVGLIVPPPNLGPGRCVCLERGKKRASGSVGENWREKGRQLKKSMVQTKSTGKASPSENEEGPRREQVSPWASRVFRAGPSQRMKLSVIVQVKPGGSLGTPQLDARLVAGPVVPCICLSPQSKCSVNGNNGSHCSYSAWHRAGASKLSRLLWLVL